MFIIYIRNILRVWLNIWYFQSQRWLDRWNGVLPPFNTLLGHIRDNSLWEKWMKDERFSRHTPAGCEPIYNGRSSHARYPSHHWKICLNVIELDTFKHPAIHVIYILFMKTQFSCSISHFKIRVPKLAHEYTRLHSYRWYIWMKCFFNPINTLYRHSSLWEEKNDGCKILQLYNSRIIFKPTTVDLHQQNRCLHVKFKFKFF